MSRRTRGRRGDRARATAPLVVLLLSLLLAGSALTGCTSPRNVLGPTASPCYRAIPVARLALRREGRFAGVWSLPGRALAPMLVGFRTASAPRVVVAPHTVLCLVGYRGRFDARRLHPLLRPGPVTGTLAVVVVRQRDERVLGIFVLDHARRRLRKVLPIH